MRDGGLQGTLRLSRNAMAGNRDAKKLMHLLEVPLRKEKSGP
jgi:hypothetical protein